MTTTSTPNTEVMKARLVLALLTGGILWAAVMFLQERAALEPFVLVVLSAISFCVQTGGRGFPMRTPAVFGELVDALRRAMGKNLAEYVASGSRVWTLLQATVFGLAAWGLQAGTAAILPASAPDWLSPVLSLTLLGFGFALLARRFAAENPAADRFRDVGEAVRKLLKSAGDWARERMHVEVTMSLPPTVMLAITAVARAVAVELLKRGVLAVSSLFFSWYIAVVLVLGAAIVIVAPEVAKTFLGVFRPRNTKEDTESSTD